MQFLALTLAALPVAFAQYGGGGSASTTTSAAAASTTSSPASADGVHIVEVGNGGLTFSPSNLTAKVGEKVEFHFYPPTHSVAQASFASPCTPLANDTGFFSGGFKTASGVNSETFTITINDTKPIWYYCGFPTHCESGMVGVINAP
jgi:plastocyanin